MFVFVSDVCFCFRCLSLFQMFVFVSDVCLCFRCLFLFQMFVFVSDVCVCFSDSGCKLSDFVSQNFILVRDQTTSSETKNPLGKRSKREKVKNECFFRWMMLDGDTLYKHDLLLPEAGFCYCLNCYFD